MHPRTVRVNGNLWSALGNTRVTDRLANQKPPTLEARMLSSSHDIAFYAR